MNYTKPNVFIYRLAQLVSWQVATFVFRRKMLRNEIKGKKGPFVVIANHQAQYDFVNLIGATHRPMSFVISSSFYNALPITGLLRRMGVIPKQQFQTTIRDMKQMKRVVEHDQPLVIYPAGLMCEDGLSTPIPPATYKFLKWLNVDVYMAKTSGTYFAMPKWGRGMRRCRTYLDIYQLFTKEELNQLSLDAIRERTDEALLFDAYREQETLLVENVGNNIEGLEQVLYMCPHCRSEFTMQVKNENTLCCTKCGFEQVSDQYAFLHNHRGIGPEVRYVSDWSRMIYDQLKEQVLAAPDTSLTSETRIHMIDRSKHKYVEVGTGTVSLFRECFLIRGTIHGSEVELQIPITNLPTLPFGPGKYLEIQCSDISYRCVLNDSHLVMKFINLLKIFYELNQAATKPCCAETT